jgi:hypothetical protein
MRLSTEAIVAAAVAGIFAALSVAGIAREHDNRESSAHNVFVATSNSSPNQISVNSHGVLRFN